MVQAYYGDGKGKTSAAMGAALRALGHRRRVFIVQFLKGRMSGEAKMLSSMNGVTLLMGKPNLPFSWEMTPQERAETAQYHWQQFERAKSAAFDGQCDMLVFDEILGAIESGLFDEVALLNFLDNAPKDVEVILTGRTLGQAVRDRAQYITKLVCEEHPFAKGTSAREGIEY